MTFKPALTPEKEQELITEYEDGWTINELSIIYRVSIRTVYRILNRHQVPFRDNKRRKRRQPKQKATRELLPCGTNAAYQRHRRKNEYPCTDCLVAHAIDVKEAKGR